jgi:serine protease inhibitor
MNEYIKSLKELKLESFEEGYATIIEGYIPMFKAEYELNLVDNLKKLGVTDVFDSEKANLSRMTSEKEYIDPVLHKANIEFSNEGIKASAATALGGAGSTSCGFEHRYEVPLKKINITFDKPYMYLVRDKESGEVWFTGTVYSPVTYIPAEGGM